MELKGKLYLQQQLKKGRGVQAGEQSFFHLQNCLIFIITACPLQGIFKSKNL